MYSLIKFFTSMSISLILLAVLNEIITQKNKKYFLKINNDFFV